MGCFRSEMSMHAVTVEVAASCETMLATRFDIENLPEMSPDHIQSVELLDPGDKEKIGMKWRERRLYNGKSFEMINTLTDIQTNCDDGSRICCHYNVCYDNKNWETAHANQTGTLSIYPVHETACRVILTNNFIAEGLRATLWMNLLGCCIRRYAVTYMTEELEDCSAVAVARQAQTTPPPAASVLNTKTTALSEESVTRAMD